MCCLEVIKQTFHVAHRQFSKDPESSKEEGLLLVRAGSLYINVYVVESVVNTIQLTYEEEKL